MLAVLLLLALAAAAAPVHGPGERATTRVLRQTDGAMVVRIGGTTDRQGGGTYHITWSLDREAGRRAKESNDVIAELGWSPEEALDWPAYKERLAAQASRWEVLGVNFYRAPEIDWR